MVEFLDEIGLDCRRNVEEKQIKLVAQKFLSSYCTRRFRPCSVTRFVTIPKCLRAHCDFKLALTRKLRLCRGTFTRANQADYCMSLLHCAQRSTPWLLDTSGCDRNVECFSLFERYVSVHGRLHSNSLFAVIAAGCCVPRNLTTSSFGGKEKTFLVVSLHLTVQLPCLNVFSSFILPLIIERPEFNRLNLSLTG